MNSKTFFYLVAGATLSYGVILAAPQWLTFVLVLALGKGLVVLGLILLMRAGLVSFGQGLYYCIGGYFAGVLTQKFGITDVFVILVGGAVLAVGVAAIVGQLLCRYRAIFFSMFSMAVSMILYGILVRSQGLGSTDGFNVAKPSLLGWTPAGDQALGFIAAITIVSVFGLGYVVYRYTQALAGYSGEAVRENEIRVEYLGGSAFQIIYSKYLLAAALAAVGGGITALTVGHVDPEMAYWTTSGEFVFIAVMGGTAHVAAPLSAAVLFELLRTYAFAVAPFTWQIILGGSLLTIIIFLPKGLWSLLAKIQTQFKGKST